MTPKEAKAIAKKNLGESRYRHTVNVKKMAVKLAQRNGVPEDQAAVAAYLHDAAKELPKEQLLQIIRENAIMAENAAERPAPVWHGICAAILARTQWGVTDEAILQAVACHTTGRPDMTTLDKVLFLADMTSDERDYPGVNKLRKLALKDLDAAMLKGLRQTIDFVRKSNKPVDPMSAAAYEDLLRKAHKKGE